jgi:hypothetical protein
MTLFRKCLCSAVLPARSTERANYVLGGHPLCSFSCYVQYSAGIDSDADCLPENPRNALIAEPIKYRATG